MFLEEEDLEGWDVLHIVLFLSGVGLPSSPQTTRRRKGFPMNSIEPLLSIDTTNLYILTGFNFLSSINMLCEESHSNPLLPSCLA